MPVYQFIRSIRRLIWWAVRLDPYKRYKWHIERRQLFHSSYWCFFFFFSSSFFFIRGRNEQIATIACCRSNFRELTFYPALRVFILSCRTRDRKGALQFSCPRGVASLCLFLFCFVFFPFSFVNLTLGWSTPELGVVLRRVRVQGRWLSIFMFLLPRSFASQSIMIGQIRQTFCSANGELIGGFLNLSIARLR